MRGRKVARPTVIYWLVDTRTGVPFYCGKTVLRPEHRLLAHTYEAREGTRRVHAKMRECAGSVRVDSVEVVPVGGNWAAREKHWIATLRLLNPDCCNTADGGAGSPGWLRSEETKQRIAATWKGRKHSPEACAKISAFLTGRKRSSESVEKGRQKMLGRKLTAEHRAKVGAANRGRPSKFKGVARSDETRVKISAAKKGRANTPEHCAKVSAGLKAHFAAIGGKKMSAEAIAKSAASRTGQKRTPEQRARMRASRLAYIAATREQAAR